MNSILQQAPFNSQIAAPIARLVLLYELLYNAQWTLCEGRSHGNRRYCRHFCHGLSVRWASTLMCGCATSPNARSVFDLDLQPRAGQVLFLHFFSKFTLPKRLVRSRTGRQPGPRGHTRLVLMRSFFAFFCTPGSARTRAHDQSTSRAGITRTTRFQN